MAKILVVDENRGWLHFLCELLAREGYGVRAVQGAAEALLRPRHC